LNFTLVLRLLEKWLGLLLASAKIQIFERREVPASSS